ncbi:hypothetical protein BDN70DRAFT_884170 [Pholiota conissans]|uniref:Uncharacterized protein n=1 Tax=Pholiota conissans TaxID=109636 RepID=A0A9P6CQH0_9AGAR|nr:hypothetical protein BDN70DRAFT_884170 [Pholiota conissans]
MTEAGGYNLTVHFSNIRKLGVGYDGKPYICSDILTPVDLDGKDSISLYDDRRSATRQPQILWPRQNCINLALDFRKVPVLRFL